VYQGERENIIGILMAKDLLKLQRAPDLNMRTCCARRSSCPKARG
jgi:magnesium and cobalt transporter